MNQTMVIIICVGIGATIVMDIYSFILRIFKIKSLDYRLVGRWLGYMLRGKFTHHTILDSKPFPYEAIIGWAAHYFIGISFVFFLAYVFGLDWFESPTLLPALSIGIATSVAPFLIMQPSFGFGIAGAKLPNPNILRIRSLLTHMVYGIGIYITALCIDFLLL